MATAVWRCSVEKPGAELVDKSKSGDRLLVVDSAVTRVNSPDHKIPADRPASEAGRSSLRSFCPLRRGSDRFGPMAKSTLAVGGMLPLSRSCHRLRTPSIHWGSGSDHRQRDIASSSFQGRAEERAQAALCAPQDFHCRPAGDDEQFEYARRRHQRDVARRHALPSRFTLSAKARWGDRQRLSVVIGEAAFSGRIRASRPDGYGIQLLDMLDPEVLESFVSGSAN